MNQATVVPAAFFPFQANQGLDVNVPVGPGMLYLFAYDEPAALNIEHYGALLMNAKFGAKPNRVQGKAAAIFRRLALLDVPGEYSLSFIYWEDFDGPFDQALIVGPFYQDCADSMAELEEAFGKFIEMDVLEYTMIASP